ncbi:MAG: caspase family protein, partial [Acidimicrobiales bacterium]
MRRPGAAVAAAAAVGLSLLGLAPLARASAGPAPAAEKWALVIGVDRFLGRTRPNVGAVGDALAVRDALVANGWPDGQVRVLADAGATAAAIRSGFEWLARSSSQRSFSVVHYSGHVRQIGRDPDRDGEALDEHLWSHDNRYISDGEFSAAMRAVRGWLWVNVSGCEGAGLDDGISGPQRLFTAASQEHQKAYEYPQWRRSVFTGLMVDQAISQGRGDTDGDRRVSLQEAFDYAAERAPAMTAGQRYGPQTPYRAGGDASAWFLDPPPPPPSLVPPAP